VEWLAIHGIPEAERIELHNTWQSILGDLPQITADFAKEDEAFHEKLTECTGNRAMVHYLHNINERLHFVRLTDITTSIRLRETCEQHLLILDCIKDSDVRCACEAVKMNIEGGRQNVERAIKEALAYSFQNLHQGE
jgi:DNA-binding GntR family transcriptional regulator